MNDGGTINDARIVDLEWSPSSGRCHASKVT